MQRSEQCRACCSAGDWAFHLGVTFSIETLPPDGRHEVALPDAQFGNPSLINALTGRMPWPNLHTPAGTQELIFFEAEKACSKRTWSKRTRRSGWSTCPRGPVGGSMAIDCASSPKANFAVVDPRYP